MIKGYNQKQNKRYNPRDNQFKVGFALPDDVSQSVADEITEILSTTKFNKISFPVSTYRYYINSDVNESDTRVITIGYIKSYDAETGKFTIVIFNNNKGVIETFANPTLEIVFSEYNGKLGCITKLNVIDLPVNDSDDDAVVDNFEDDPE